MLLSGRGRRPAAAVGRTRTRGPERATKVSLSKKVKLDIKRKHLKAAVPQCMSSSQASFPLTVELQVDGVVDPELYNCSIRKHNNSKTTCVSYRLQGPGIYARLRGLYMRGLQPRNDALGVVTLIASARNGLDLQYEGTARGGGDDGDEEEDGDDQEEQPQAQYSGGGEGEDGEEDQQELQELQAAEEQQHHHQHARLQQGAVSGRQPGGGRGGGEQHAPQHHLLHHHHHYHHQQQQLHQLQQQQQRAEAGPSTRGRKRQLAAVQDEEEAEAALAHPDQALQAAALDVQYRTRSRARLSGGSTSSGQQQPPLDSGGGGAWPPGHFDALHHGVGAVAGIQAPNHHHNGSAAGDYIDFGSLGSPFSQALHQLNSGKPGQPNPLMAMPSWAGLGMGALPELMLPDQDGWPEQRALAHLL